MKLLSTFILLLSMLLSCAHAEVETRVYPLMRNNMKLYLALYEDPLAAPDRAYPDVLLVHDVTYSSHQFDVNVQNYSLARALAQQGFRVWLLDIAGYGRSQKPNNGLMIDADYAVDDINAAVDFIKYKKETQKINLIGFSWGTISATRFAVVHPEEVNQLVLISPITHGLALPKPTQEYHPYNEEETKKKFNLNNTDQDMLRTYLDQAKRYDGAGSPNGGRKDLSQSKRTQLMPYDRLTVPVFAIGGDKDHDNVQKEFALIMKYAPKGSCSDIIKGAGHYVFLEKPYQQQFLHDISLFLISGCDIAWAPQK